MAATQKPKSKPQIPPKPTHLLGGNKAEETLLPSREEQQRELNAALGKLEEEVKSRQAELASLEEDVVQMKESIQQKEGSLEKEQKELERKEKLYSLLPDAPAHLSRMQKLLESNQQKMAALEQEWHEIKQPLEDEYQEWLKQHKNVRSFYTHRKMEVYSVVSYQSLAEQLKGSLEQTVQSLRQVFEEIRVKEELINTFQNRLDALPSSSLSR